MCLLQVRREAPAPRPVGSWLARWCGRALSWLVLLTLAAPSSMAAVPQAQEAALRPTVRVPRAPAPGQVTVDGRLDEAVSMPNQTDLIYADSLLFGRTFIPNCSV